MKALATLVLVVLGWPMLPVQSMAEEHRIAFIGANPGSPESISLNEACENWKEAHRDEGFVCDFYAPPTNDAAGQTSILQSLILQGVNGIVVRPVDAAAVAYFLGSVDLAIPIVTVGVDLPADARSLRKAFVTTDFQSIGAAMADALKVETSEKTVFSKGSFCLRVGQSPEANEVGLGFQARLKQLVEAGTPAMDVLDNCPQLEGLGPSAEIATPTVPFSGGAPLAAVIVDPSALSSQNYKQSVAGQMINTPLATFGFGTGQQFKQLVDDGLLKMQFGENDAALAGKALDTMRLAMDGQTFEGPVFTDFESYPAFDNPVNIDNGTNWQDFVPSLANPTQTDGQLYIGPDTFDLQTSLGQIEVEGQASYFASENAEIGLSLALPPAALRLLMGSRFDILTGKDIITIEQLEPLDVPWVEGPKVLIDRPGRGWTEYIVPGSGVNGAGPTIRVSTPGTVRVAGQYTSLAFDAPQSPTGAGVAFTNDGWPIVTPSDAAFTPPFAPTPGPGSDGTFPKEPWPERVLGDDAFLTAIATTVSDGKYAVPFFRAGFPEVVLIRQGRTGLEAPGTCSGTLIGKSMSKIAHILTAHHCAVGFFGGGGQAYLMSHEQAACVQSADMSADFAAACQLSPLNVRHIDRRQVIFIPGEEDGLALLRVELDSEADQQRPRADIGAIYGAANPLVTFTGFGFSSALEHRNAGSLQVTWGRITVPNGATLADAISGVFGVGRLTGNFSTACGGDSGGGMLLGRVFGYVNDEGIGEHELAGLVLRGTTKDGCVASASNTTHVTTTAISLHSPEVLSWLCAMTSNDLTICDRKLGKP